MRRKLKRKAQMSHVFTYLVIILVVGVVALMGYKAVLWLIETQCKQQRIGFEQSLLGFIDEYSDYGFSEEETLKAPCDVREACFVDSKYYEEGAAVPGGITDKVIKSHVLDKTDNIFIITEFTEPMGFSDKIALKQEDQPYKCFKPRVGEFKFLFKGLGRKTQIESVD
ncbi:hypothetical protein AYK26_02575 [Euryarchaeota archaeon SM23-78]|nr:MAG: hypothetical protein AYK26_02575 [Euryarchaeota archaeon SM23-78]MBW3000257.1 hypothetical protein [Candidatus Woesearchaeota archaeon]